MSDSILPLLDEAPVSARGHESRALLSRLATFGDSDDASFVPGLAGAEDDEEEQDNQSWGALAAEFEASAAAEATAIAQGRLLLLSSRLWTHVGEPERALVAAREAAQRAPKLLSAGIEYRKCGGARDALEDQQRLLEATARLAAHPGSRTHAALALFQLLMEGGDETRAVALLDHAARTGSSDSRLSFERVLSRLSRGQSAAGIEVAEGLKAAAMHFLELRAERPVDFRRGGYASLLAAARALAQADLVAAAQALSQRNEPALAELRAALLQADPAQQQAAQDLLASLFEAAPTASLLRRWAGVSVDRRDWSALGHILEAAEAFPNAFSVHERFVLRVLAAEQPSFERHELEALAELAPELALALSPLGQAPERAQELLSAELASSLQLGVRLGPSLPPESDKPTVELTLGPGDTLALSFWQLDAALAAGDAPTIASEFSRLARLLDDTSAQLLGGISLELRGQADAARELYESVLSQPALGLAALRGLASFDPSSASRLLLDYAQQTPDPERAADAELEAALLGPAEGRASGVLRAAEAWDDSALLVAAASLFQIAGDDNGLSHVLERLSSSSEPTERRVALIRTALLGIAREPSQAARTLGLVSEELRGADGSLKLAAALLGALEQEPSQGHADELGILQDQRAARSLLEGDDTRALPLLRDLARAGSNAASLLADELSESSGDVARLSERWLTLAKSEDLATRRYAYERLAQLDLKRGDRSSSLLWQRSAVEEFPEARSALLRLEDFLFSEGRVGEWPFLRDKLARLLPAGDRDAYALLAGAFALGALDLRDASRLLEPLSNDERPHLLALRSQSSRAKERGDDAAVATLSLRLAELATSDLDQAALLLESANARARSEQPEAALDVARRALAARPDSYAASLLVARLVPETRAAEQAAALRVLAQNSRLSSQRSAFLVEAGQTELDLGDSAAATSDFRGALAADPSDRVAFENLQELYLVASDLDALAELLAGRLDAVVDANEKVDLGLRLTEVLLELGRPEDARRELERALPLAPDNAQVLRAHALVCQKLGDDSAARDSLVALLAVLPGKSERLAILRSLGTIYEERLGLLELAMDAYEGVLELSPDDREIELRLVGVFTRLGLGERATTLQTKLIQGATTEEEKRQGALALAGLYEGIGKDPKRALATLERALKAWPLDAEVVESAALFMERQGDSNNRRALVDHVSKEALRSLIGTRLDASLLDTLSRAARLAEIPAQAEAALAVRGAFLGESTGLAGAFVQALDPALDDFLSPSILSAPLRNLLSRTGAVLDTAFSLDLSALGAVRAQPSPSTARLAEFSAALGGPVPEVVVAASLGSRCQPLSLSPLRFVIGPGLDDLSPRARDYAIARAFKVQRLGASALARTKPEDAWPMLAALLLLFAPNWRPKSLDARKVAQARALVEQGLARVGYDDDVPTLALEAIGALGEQGEGLGSAIRTLAMRTALLAVGDPAAALESLSAGSDKPLPAHGPGRFRWFEGHPEAKEMLLFAIGDEHARARERLGLAAARAHRAPLPPRAGSLGPLPPRRS